jgi:membrane protease subunit (stomatin/prohibitin family)
MSWWNRLKGQASAQFLDVIQWLDDSNDTIVYRFPIHDQAITDQSKVVVREGQAAVFIAEGQMSDVFAPGTYTLNTPNTPIQSFFSTIAYSFNNPYKGDILFVSTRQFTDNGWGTQNPFMMRDPEFGPIRVRAFGTYAFRVTDPAAFIRQVVGTDGLFTTSEISGHIKKRVVSSLASSIGKSGIPVLDLVSNYEDLGRAVLEKINPEFDSNLGVSLTDLTIGNISLPKQVEEALDNRSKMGILGNLNAYTQLRTADAIEHAARNPGLAGAGVGMGVGMGVGHAVSSQMTGSAGHFNPQTGMQGPPPTSSAPPTLHYNGPSGAKQLSAAQIAGIVAADRHGDHKVWANGWPDWKSWRDVSEVASLVPPATSTTPPPTPAGPPPAPSEPSYHYHGVGGEGERPLSEVVAAVRAAPDGKHHVWQAGWDGWKPVSDVDAIVRALETGPPPPPAGDEGPPPPPA